MLQFPDHLSLNAEGGPEYYTHIETRSNGKEVRTGLYQNPKRRFDIGSAIQTYEDLQRVISFFYIASGRLRPFRFRDWIDCHSHNDADPIERNIFARGDGIATKFQLKKSYNFDDYSYFRDINYPRIAGFELRIGDFEPKLGEDYFLSENTGEVTFVTPPESGAPIMAKFTFDILARFETDQLLVTNRGFEAGEITDIAIIEVDE